MVMANVKSIVILGRIPYNTYEYPKLNELLGQLNSPSSGIRITYSAGCIYRKNENGGKTAMHAFDIQGKEGVSVDWVNLFRDEVKKSGGCITSVYVYDIDNKTELLNQDFDEWERAA